ncbi:MAG TPA: RNA polymerase sigma-54 factor, partial [Verrucomicrobiae bacterium]|nr:RNA polymerase sigma-54 factor [Verrucomicrobiae bacterium]
MAMEMRQQLKLSQQLVMTPQLQQAIKLLQLSRLELQDVVRQELEENPLLEETIDVEERGPAEPGESDEVEARPEEVFAEATSADESTRDIDWETYIEGYSYSSGEQYHEEDDDRPSYENMLTRKGNLFDHLMWQLSMGKFTDEEAAVGAEIIGNIDEDGYFRAELGEVAAVRGVDDSFVEQVLLKIQEFDPM